MKTTPNKAQQLFLIILFISSWFAVLFQYYLSLGARVDSVGMATFRFISYFTILTNTLVGVCTSYLLLNPGSKLGQFFAKPRTLTAVTVYIVIVGLIYNLILRWQWDPQGAQYVVDLFLHTIIPAGFLIYWFAFVPKKELQWKHVFPWLIYPLIYMVYILIRGAIINEYPYPFVDVTVLGYKDALINGVGVLFTFLAVSLLLVAIAKWTSRKSR